MKELFFEQSPTSKSPLYLDSSIFSTVVFAASVVTAASATELTMAATLSLEDAAGTVGTAGAVGTSTAGTPPGSICLFLRLNPIFGVGGAAGPSPSVVGAATNIKLWFSFAQEPINF